MIIELPDRQPFSLYLERDVVALLKRKANGKCERCGGHGFLGALVCHHIFPLNDIPRNSNLFNHPSNREILCPSCHIKEHRRRRRALRERLLKDIVSLQEIQGEKGVRLQVVKLKKDHPYLLAIEIASLLGVSRERVRQILLSEGMRTRESAWGYQAMREKQK